MHIMTVLRVVLVATAVSLAACASVTTSPTQTVSVETEPEGAMCKLTREGVFVAIVNPTPASISIEKSKNDITVTCEKPGYLATEETLPSEFQAMTLGNAILGGLIGVAIDATSGAMHSYPALVKVPLTPERFASAQERDAFFDAWRARVTADAKKSIDEIMNTCPKDDPSQASCRARVQAIEKARDEKLQRIGKQQLVAQVD